MANTANHFSSTKKSNPIAFNASASKKNKPSALSILKKKKEKKNQEEVKVDLLTPISLKMKTSFLVKGPSTSFESYAK
jgi:hypothetical protein